MFNSKIIPYPENCCATGSMKIFIFDTWEMEERSTISCRNASTYKFLGQIQVDSN